MTNKKLYLTFIGGLIILGIVAFLVGPALFAPARPSNTGTPTPGPATKSEVFREDGVLHFRSPDGATRASISIEISDKEETRTQGLMGRQLLAPNHGMLFVFENTEERSFWMANTPLPLDIIYLDSDKLIVQIHRDTKPYSEESLPSGKPARYVVEVNAGFCAQHGVEIGDSVQWLHE